MLAQGMLAERMIEGTPWVLGLWVLGLWVLGLWVLGRFALWLALWPCGLGAGLGAIVRGLAVLCRGLVASSHGEDREPAVLRGEGIGALDGRRRAMRQHTHHLVGAHAVVLEHVARRVGAGEREVPVVVRGPGREGPRVGVPVNLEIVL